MISIISTVITKEKHTPHRSTHNDTILIMQLKYSFTFYSLLSFVYTHTRAHTLCPQFTET